jgi:L-asparagine transporter-like permease
LELKFLFEFLTDSFSLLENSLEDYVVMTIIGVIAYVIAYRSVGKLYSYDLIDGRGAGYFFHWIIRFIVFVVIFYAAATAIRVYAWFHGLPDYKWLIIVGTAVGVIALIIVVRIILNRRERTINS